MKTELKLDERGIITDECWFHFKREAYCCDAIWNSTRQRCEYVYATEEESLKMLCVALLLAKERLTDIAVKNMELGTLPAGLNTNIGNEKL